MEQWVVRALVYRVGGAAGARPASARRAGGHVAFRKPRGCRRALSAAAARARPTFSCARCNCTCRQSWGSLRLLLH